LGCTTTTGQDLNREGDEAMDGKEMKGTSTHASGSHQQLTGVGGLPPSMHASIAGRPAGWHTRQYARRQCTGKCAAGQRLTDRPSSVAVAFPIRSSILAHTASPPLDYTMYGGVYFF